jgi:hypothetical protein
MLEQINIKPNNNDGYNKQNYSQNILDRFWSKVIFPINLIDSCWIWDAAKNSNKLNRDYGIFYVNSNIGNQRAHRFAYEYFYGLILPNLEVLHKCDTPSCVNPNHLRPGTQQDNINDMINKNRDNKAVGGNNGNSVLNDDQVKEIITKVYNNQYSSVQQICKIYNCSEMVIHNIFHRKFWTHITEYITDIELTQLRCKINSRNKLTGDDIKNIKIDLKNNITFGQISQKYNISRTMIGNIKHGRNYANITI